MRTQILGLLLVLVGISTAWSQPVLWLKSDAGLALNADGSVATWTDQSLNGYVFEADGSATSPSRVGGAINALPAIRFDGTTRLAGSAGGANLQNASIFALFRYNMESSSNDYVYSFGAASGSGSQMTLSRRSGNRAYHYDGSITNIPDDSCIVGGQWQVTSQIFGDGDGARHDLYQYGNLAMSTNATEAYDVDGSLVRLGSYSNGGSRFVGDLVELIVYDRVLNNAERAQVERYLRYRIGVTDRDSIDTMEDWSVSQYPFETQGEADWQSCSAGAGAIQSSNADASMLLSDFNVRYRTITGSLATNGSQDFYGFVFGHQNAGQYYLFDWKQTTANYFSEEATEGMRLRVVNYPGGGAPTGAELWASQDLGGITTLRSNDVPWVRNRAYTYRVIFRPGAFTVTIFDQETVVENWTVLDGTFPSGGFGVFNSSLGTSSYGVPVVVNNDIIFADGFEAEPVPLDVTP